MELRPYQQEDLKFLLQHNIVGIFNQQRTGKTPTVLSYIKEKHPKKTLIVCPASLTYMWKDEYEKWTGKPCIILKKDRKTDIAIKVANWTSDGAVVSYDQLKPTKSKEGMCSLLLNAHIEAIILDEAHRIKNPKTAQAKAVFRFINTPIRVALTGTPAPNAPEEIFSLLHWMYPTTFRNYYSFINNYFITYTVNMGPVRFKKVVSWRKGACEHVQRILANNCINRKRKEVMPWLPKKDINTINLDATKEQLKYLQELSEWFETDNVVTTGILDRMIRYRQICTAPELVNLKGKSPKTQWIIQYLRDYPDKPILIFSNFTSYLEILKRDISANTKRKIGIITGRVTSEKRYKYMHDFQHGKLDLMLINIKAGKEGLTLDRAETSIFTDIFPPVSDLEQAEDRLVSTKKELQNKPCTIIRLCLRNTFDEELIKMVKLKASQVDVINNFQKYLGGAQHESAI